LTCSFSVAFVIDSEFNNTSEPADTVYTRWASAGSNADIDSVLCINVTAIPDSMTYLQLGVYVPIPDAQSGEENDNSSIINGLINWIKGRVWHQSIHAQIYIPAGTYHFRDQIVLASNISLKGDGSDKTELIFLIDADPSSTNMTVSDCKKDAILVMGEGELPNQLISKAGIEDLKIIRDDGGRPHDDIKEDVGGYVLFNGVRAYWGNNIAIRRATDCWVKGVESENTFRNHVTMEYATNNTISGVYFHDANNYGDGGFGYGVGIRFYDVSV